MKGGKQRASLTDEAALRGRMDPRDVEHLQTYIREWCLREEAPANIQAVEEPFPNSGLVIADRVRSGSPAPTEPDLVSPPLDSPCPSVTLGVSSMPFFCSNFLVKEEDC